MWFELPKNKSIRKTVLNILIIYLSTTILLVLTIAILYTQNQKQQLFTQTKQQLDIQAKYFIEQLELLHDNIVDEDAIYPQTNGIKTAIYDVDKNLIYSTYKEKLYPQNKTFIIKDKFIYFIYTNEPYYLGAKYIVFQVPKFYIFDNTKIFTIVILVILVLIFTSVILIKLLIKPLSNNLIILDKFIKDTTHELNTPLSVILNNIEMLDESELSIKNLKKIDRIKLGATTISNIYKDLTFLLLEKKTSINTKINVSDILNQRIEYFTALAHSKKLNFIFDIQNDVFITIDQNKLERLFDNLISNSIKYSYPNNTITITLENNKFSISDKGIGMKPQEVENIFIRYKRFDTSVGGFGIGYDIINSITKEYNIKIEILSKKQEGTKVILRW